MFSGSFYSPVTLSLFAPCVRKVEHGQFVIFVMYHKKAKGIWFVWHSIAPTALNRKWGNSFHEFFIVIQPIFDFVRHFYHIERFLAAKQGKVYSKLFPMFLTRIFKK